MPTFIGTSGWQYSDWNGVIYPQHIAAKDQLEYYASMYNTVEINSTFYHMPRITTTEKWYNQVPDNFRFTLKLNRYLTHTKKLVIDKESLIKLDEFIASATMLKEKLGMVLVQLPPSLRNDIERLTIFLQAVDGTIPLALECRHDSWFTLEVQNLLRNYNVMWVINDSPNRWPSAKYVINHRLYIRFHGSRELYKSKYTSGELKEWADYISSQNPKEVWIYFNNTIAAAGAKNAKTLAEMVNL